MWEKITGKKGPSFNSPIQNPFDTAEPVGLEDLLWKSQGGVRVRCSAGPDPNCGARAAQMNPSGKGPMFLPEKERFCCI